MDKWTPGGSQTRSKSLAAYGLEGLIGPVWDSEGATFRTADGCRYIDWVCGLGAISLGYGRAEVVKAIEEQLRYGTLFSLPHRLEGEVAERLCTALRWPEQVRWVKTGSESTEAAIRIARRATGRDVILTVGTGYHGWHSWSQAVKPEHPGVPENYAELVGAFQYNDLASLQLALECQDMLNLADFLHSQASGLAKRKRGEVAAVILEPTLFEAPVQGFLEGIRKVCDREGALLISDEMVLGFRLALGGGTDYFGVQPDLACFGKGMSNGMPLACVVGKRDLMQYADVVSGTFGGECLSLAACKAVLDVYALEPVIEHLWRIGGLFQDGLNKLLAQHELPGIVEGYPVHPRLRWTAAPPYDRLLVPDMSHPVVMDLNRKLMSLWLQEMAAGGVLVHPSGWNVSYAHTTEDVTWSLDVADKAFAVCKRALESGDWSALKGKLIKDNPFRPS